ncbi:hypothetical protein PWT90_09628 [Aphanocladium album]|nr:hypothetical protein PWT90_09628 [Aphanocladium album]
MFSLADGTLWPHGLPIFDFSLKFEESILQILPSVSFIFFASSLFLYYLHTKIHIRQSNLLWIKVTISLVLCVLELASLVLRCFSDDRTNTTDAAAALELAAAVAIAAVVYAEHRHAIRTSALLGLYLAIGTLIDGTKSRSFFQRDLIASGAVAAATCVVRFTLIVLEEVPKTKLIIDPGLRSTSDGEATCGFFGRLLLLFLRPMMRTGYRGALAMEDLGNLGAELASRHLFSRLDDSWPTARRNQKHSLFFACCKAFKWHIFVIFIPRLLVTGCMFAQPYVMYEVIASIQRPNDERKGGLVGATLLTFLGSALFRAATERLKNRLVTQVRGALISQILDKSYRLRVSDSKKQAAITLMGADFAGVAAGIPNCIEVPVSILESGLGMYFLSRFIRQSCLVLLGPLFLSAALSYILGKYSSPAMTYWNEHVQVRVAKTSKVLSQLPAIKALGLGPKVAEFIQHLRVVETIASKKFRFVQALSLGSAVMVDRISPVLVVVVGIYTHMFGDKINAEVLYPTLGIVTLVQTPLARLLKLYPSVTSMLGCMERFRTFLCLDEHADPRKAFPASIDGFQEKASTSAATQHTFENVMNQGPLPILRFEKASIAPRGSDEAVLSNIDLSINEGSVTSMFGPTGSGKTTFTQSILGEAELLEGDIFVQESLGAAAVCGQEAYLPNMTIEACIIGACEYDPVWFNAVIKCCSLVDDLAQLPSGQHYVIGSGGVGLSGGQRQRIGIARAVYVRARMVVLDDVFSSLDKRTAIEVLYGLCGKNGLLRQQNCTVLISSHLSESLEVADNLILLDGTGKVSFEARRSGGKVQLEVTRLLEQGPLNGGGEEVGAEEKDENDSPAQHPSTPSHVQSRPTKHCAGITREGDAGHRGSKNLYLLWINTVGRSAMLTFTVFLFLMALSESFPTIYLRIWVSLAPSNNLYLIGYALISVSAGLLCSICLYGMFSKLAPRASLGLHERLTYVVTRATIGFLSSTDTGSLLNRYSEDMDGLSKEVPAKIYSMLYFSFTVMINIGAILAGATYMTAILPAVLGIIYFVQRYYLRTSCQLRLLDIEVQAPLVSSLRDISTGLVYIRGFQTQKHDYARCLHQLDQAQKPYYFLLACQTLLSLVLESVVTLMALTLSILALYAHGSTTPNAAGLAFLNLITLGTGLNLVVTTWTSMETSLGALARVRDFLRDTPTEENKQGQLDLPENWPSKGEVIFKDVVARYKVNTKSEEPEPAVLQNIGLHLQPGKKIGVMGRTGSGKSSLLYAILGFLEYQGTISIDGIDLKTAHPDQLRSRIITISQDLVELDGTIRDNLLPYEKSWPDTQPTKLNPQQRQEAERKDEILRETLIRLQIWDQLPRKGGLGAILNQVGYSHGEKQLLCIARAVVRRRLTGSKLVLVDEATASVDKWRDQIVREMMVGYFRDCTVIIVAHRKETIADSDQMVLMASGQVERVEDYDELQG